MLRKWFSFFYWFLDDLSGLACDTTKDSRYFKINGTCYFTDNQLRSYTASQQYCKLMGGHLWEPRSNFSFKEIRGIELDIAGVTSRGTWIGITDFFQQGNYKYASDNGALRFNMWDKGLPSSDYEKNCVAVQYSNLHDHQCSSKFHLICQQIKGE